MKPYVAFILKGYPRLSETFIAQEIAGLEQCGLPIRIISLRQPTDRHTHPVHAQIKAPLRYLPEYLYREPWRILRAWWQVRRWPNYRMVRALWLKDLWRDPTPNRGRRFGQALVLAAELENDVRWLHAHFLHTPASVTRYAAKLRNLPFSISAHAKDIWTSPAWEKQEKLADCAWLVTCTAQNRDHLVALGEEDKKVTLVYHGFDFDRFPHFERSHNDMGPGQVVNIISVGRAVPKKGYEDLLQALAQIPKDRNWHFTHIGGGELTSSLKKLAGKLDIASCIEWRGAQPQQMVLQALQKADIFALACRVAKDGDQDGLPNVLMEAQSQGLPCVSTKVAAIPELIRDGETGLLVAAGDVAALAIQLTKLIDDRDLRMRLGRAAELHVREHFGMTAGLMQLASKFGLSSPSHIEDRSCELASMHR